MANAEAEPVPSQQPPIPFIDQNYKALLLKFIKILKDFKASNDQVYKYDSSLSSEEEKVLTQLCGIMRLGYLILRSPACVWVYKQDGEALTKIQAALSRKRKRGEKLDLYQKKRITSSELASIWTSQILEKFTASNGEVYTFNDLTEEERYCVQQVCQKMGFVYTVSRDEGKQKVLVHNLKKAVDSTMVLNGLPRVTFSEELIRNKEDLEPPHHKNHIVDESSIAQIFRILETFLASKYEVYNFEANLSAEEWIVVHLLSRMMGFIVGYSRNGIKKKLSVHKIRMVGAPSDFDNLPHFTFSDESKKVIGGLLMHHLPGNDELGVEMIGTSSDTTDRTEHEEDDFFIRPYMSKVDITNQVKVLAGRMSSLQYLKQITEKRSKLPIALFKDVILSTIESQQVVIISGETGCGKTTQVPQYILDHMWGKGEVCKIVCTQPRHISAISVSERISSERGESIGHNVGYKIPLECRGGRQSSIILCTTEVLLKVLASKGSCWLRTRSAKDDISSITHIIMDEIHERDRYSDLLLAILRQMLPSNPHLRLILMGASLDAAAAARFSRYFGECPIIHVPGLTYPVKSYYLEDVISIIKLGEDNHLDSNHELSQEDKISLDKAINLAWSNDDWGPLLEFVFSGGPNVFNYQHSVTGLNPLMVFAGKGKVGDMCMLLSIGANCHLRTKDGTTALDIAVKGNQQVAAELLKKHMNNDFSYMEGNKFLENLKTVSPELLDVVLATQLIRKICIDSKDGGILVFLPCLDVMHKTRERLLASPFFNDTEKFIVISLHSMVPYIEEKVFMRPPPGCRKIVLATDIAETAIILDDIVYVIDTGRVKEKSYDPCNNVFTLHSSWVSKASAKQREGHAGRCQPGICYHLYSKVQADSLLDFHVPEIKRMPIEDLCLQVKLLDPSSRIEAFFSQTLDPPGLKSIENAVAVLQRIGALSKSEKLTELGKKLGSLPVHPLAGKMLIFSILMNCLDPALTLACSSVYEDPFTHPVLHDEKKRAAASRFELASLYGGCSDHLSIIAVFECWKNSTRMGLEERFCSQYFVSQSTMHMLSSMRMKLATELFQNGLIHDDVSSYCLNSHDPGILNAVLVAGMYPVLGKSLPNESGNRVFVKTETCNEVGLTSHSVNFKLFSQKNFGCSLLVYDEIARDDWGMSISNCTVVGPLPLLLLSEEVAVTSIKDSKEGDKSSDNIVRVIVDQWLDFQSKALDISHLNYLRDQLSAAILFKVTHSTFFLPPILGAAMSALACILSCDGLSGIPQTSDGAVSLTTTVNATNLGKQAPGTELINHGAVPSSDLSISTFEGVENQSDLTSQNTAISSACTISTVHVAKGPGEYHSELVNHDVALTSVPFEENLSTPMCIKNPSDPTSQITPIDSDHVMVAVDWIAPETGWIKANTDGSYLPHSKISSCAGVFRDATGSWCFGFVQNLGPSFSGVMSDKWTAALLAELSGILNALKLGREKGISKLWVESDSGMSVDLILGKLVEWKSPSALCTSIVRSIVQLMRRRDWTVRLSHTYREANTVADCLAKYAYTNEVGFLHVLDVPPSECIKFLTEDHVGLGRVRSVHVNNMYQYNYVMKYES